MTQDTTGTTDATSIAQVTRDQIRHLADAITAETARVIAKKTKTTIAAGDVALLQRVATGAVNFAISPTPDASDTRGVKGQQRKFLNLNAQLSAIESIGDDIATDRFWQIVSDVLGRMSSLALTSVVTAAIAAV